MKNLNFNPRFNVKSLVQVFSLLLIFLLSIAQAQAQTYNLKEYVLGNSYDPNNRSFVWEASKYCDYNWSIRPGKIDYLGGELELHAAPVTKPDCKSIYKISWTFSKDMRTVTCGEKVFVDIINMPISKQNCGIFVWEGDNNPSSVKIFASGGVGESSLVREEELKDPGGAYRDYVFLHYPEQVIQGETPSYRNKNVHLRSGRAELVVCSRPDMAKNAHGGSFTFRIGNKGISFDVVYLYSKDAIIITSPTASLPNPIFQHGLLNPEGVYWMNIQLPGYLRGYRGKQVYVVIRFVDAYGNLLIGNAYDTRYVDANGYAATGSGLITIPTDNYDLRTLQLWMPYYALNMSYVDEQHFNNITAYAEVIADGQTVAQSRRLPLSVVW